MLELSILCWYKHFDHLLRTQKYQMNSQLKDLTKLYKKFKKKEVTKDSINSMYYEIRVTYRTIDKVAYLKTKLRSNVN